MSAQPSYTPVSSLAMNHARACFSSGNDGSTGPGSGFVSLGSDRTWCGAGANTKSATLLHALVSALTRRAYASGLDA